MVGMALACALSENADLSIVILEASQETSNTLSDAYHHRVSAIALSSMQIFQSLQVWHDIVKARVSPFVAIQVWDASNKTNLKFECNDIAEPALGYIIENNVMQQVLRDKLKSLPNVQFVSAVTLTKLVERDDCVTLMSDQCHYQARIAVAADGANSWLRRQVGVQIKGQSYDQEAIVATVETARPHEKIARQVFLSSGPLAFLPLKEPNTSSIVWSLPREEARRISSMDEEAFKLLLAEQFSERLGKIVSVGQRFTFPLKRQQSAQYVQGRVVLAGDAAHVMHPLAGQGVNLGLLDAASLAEVILDAVHHDKDFSELSCLRRYERWRRADNLALLAGVDIIKNIFSSEKSTVQVVRSLGMSMASRVSMLKNIVTRYAVGCREGLPRIARS
tara:strand:+ start:2331 stop:3503 length:1173 start_codon:yes stop_codon:yes gene_type:complete